MHGGITHISRVLGLGRDTISKGVYELMHPESYPPLAEGRHRKDGGGRKKR